MAITQSAHFRRWQAWQEGYDAAMMGNGRSLYYRKGSGMRRAYDEGYDEGTRHRA